MHIVGASRTQRHAGLMVDVSVIIPVWNDADQLLLCLQALARQTLPPGDFEVVVIDNGSRVPVRAQIDVPDGLQVVWAVEETPGSYAARNAGIVLAQGRILAFTDADCRPGPAWLEHGTQLLGRSQMPCYVAGKIDLTPSSPDGLSATDAFEAVANFNQERQIREAGYAATANLFVRRADFDAVGAFDTLMSGGDFQWCRRAMVRGLNPVYCPDAVVRHPARGSRGSVLQRELRMVGGHRDLEPGWSSALKYALRFALPPRRQISDILSLPRADLTGTNRFLAIAFAIEIRLRIAANRLYLEWTGAASPRI